MKKILDITNCGDCPYFYDEYLCTYYGRGIYDNDVEDFDSDETTPNFCKVEQLITKERE